MFLLVMCLAERKNQHEPTLEAESVFTENRTLRYAVGQLLTLGSLAGSSFPSLPRLLIYNVNSKLANCGRERMATAFLERSDSEQSKDMKEDLAV